MDPIQIVLLN